MHPRPSLAKIIATIGPASEQLPVLQQVVSAGMRVSNGTTRHLHFPTVTLYVLTLHGYYQVMRINFSHATFEEADLRVKNIKLVSGMPRTMLGE
jgi:pyruvate kinase